MPRFHYLCLNEKGKRIKGAIEAPDLNICRAYLKKEGFFPIKISAGEATKKPLFYRWQKKNPQELIGVLRQLASLISSHIPVLDAVETITPQIKNPALAQTFLNLAESLRRGNLFSESLRRESIFPETLPELVAVSEATGTLGLILSEFARSQETALSLRRRMVTNLIYPLFLVGVSILILLFLFMVVLPKVTSVFAESGMSLPAFTRFVLSVTHYLRRFGIPFLIIAGGVCIIWRKIQTTQKRREYFWRLLRRLAFTAELSRKYSLSLFARNLAILHKGGVKLIEALRLIENIVPDKIFRQEITRIEFDLNKGVSLSQALGKSSFFPPYLIQMVKVGEETGELSPMLEKVAVVYAEEVETGLARLVTLLEPTMIVVMGILVGGIVVSVLLPIFEMSRIIK